LGEAEEPWWKKAAQGVVETVKEKLVKKESVVEPNFGRTHPDILAGIREKFRGSVIHIWELGKFKSENRELCCYGVILEQEFEFEGMNSFKSILVVYSEGKAQFAVVAEPKLLRSESAASVVTSELNWLALTYTLYKEFASTKPWVRYNSSAFEEFKLTKTKAKK
jgi:hypothetical protein